MIEVRRLKAVGMVLGVAAVFTCAHVWGEPGRDKPANVVKPADVNLPSGKADQDLAADMASSRFSDDKIPLVTYQAEKDAPIQWGLKLKLKVDAAPRPKDVLVLISNSAGMAQGPLAAALKSAETLAGSLAADDRLAVWTISTKANPCSKSAEYSSGFRPGDKLKDVFADLTKNQYPSGAVDLKTGLTDAVASFTPDPARQRVILFFGDCKSIANPLDGTDRAALCDQMVRNEIAFFAVPLGVNIDSTNLHGLVSGTGGKVVRSLVSDKPESLTFRLNEAFAEPILYPTAFQPPAGATDVYPTRLPPLRADAPTLVIGKIPAGVAKFDYSVSGRVSGQEKRIDASETMPTPDVANYFLVSIAGQWQAAKDRPALLQADRALSFAWEQHEVAREDLLAKAYWALDADQLDPAFKLFQKAKQLDPHCQEAQSGMDIVAQIRDGKVTKEQLFQQLKQQKPKGAKDAAPRGQKDDRAAKDTRVAMADPLPNPAQVDAPPAPPRDILADAKARQAVADQQANQLVQDTIRRANQKVLVKPADAVRDLKQVLEDVRSNPDLSEGARVSLVDQLQQSSRTVDRTARRVQGDQEEAQEAAAEAAARAGTLAGQELVEKQTRERMRQYADMMHLAREEAAYLQAQSIREDLVAQGQPVPVSVTAGYQIGLVGYNLRELNNLKRLRSERWLATLLSVEESAIPFPDEPPIRFPDSSYIKMVTKLRYGASGSQFDNWKDFSEYRLNVKRYASSTFGSPDEVGRALEFQKKLNERIDYELLVQAPLDHVLDELLTRQGIPWSVNEAAFVAAQQDKDVIKKTEVEKIDKMTGVTRATVLKRLLAKIANDGGKGVPTYLIRPDAVEITTTDAAVRDKVVRVYPVADLVTPIGGQVPQGGIFGFVGQPNQLGGSALGGLQQGLQVGGLQVGGLQVGGLQVGGLQVGGLQVGGLQVGGLQLGLQIGGIQIGGQLGIQLGGQLGQLGGQLGQQGQNAVGGLGGPGAINGLLQVQQANQLTDLIKQVVGNYKDWQKPIDPLTGKPLDPMADGDPDPLTTYNDIGYYGPAQALVVKAQTRVHTRASDPLSYAGAPPTAMIDVKHHVDVAGVGNERDPKAPQLDPKVVWQDALAKGVDDPGMIVATADFLAQQGKWDHVTEFLKADLRQGIVVRPWVYKSLAIALRESQASSDEIERAEMSSAEMEPLDAQGFLDASRAMAGDKRWDRALAFAKEAAVLEPSTPYAYNEALLYAEAAQDVPGMEWAAGHLLSQDWPVSNKNLQDKALRTAESLARTLEQKDRKSDGQKLLDVVSGQRQRDLVIKLTWQGEADLDLKVKEPTGSVCWVLNRQTIGGGALAGDGQSDPNSETYQAAQAFSGDYEITVDRAWGRALSDTAQLTIIRRQGTKDESQELVTIDLKSHTPYKLKVTDGRRTEAAYVPPPAAARPIDEAVMPSNSKVGFLNQLRKLSQPEVESVTVGFHGSTVGMGTSVATAPAAVAAPGPGDHLIQESKLASFIQNSLEVTSQTVLSADRQSVRVSMTPMFNTATDARPVVSSSVIPGAPQP